MLTPHALELLKGVVDIWLPDFKFGNDDCARRIAGIDGYTSIVQRNMTLIQDQQHIVVRHMVIPGHDRCCTSPVQEFISHNHPDYLLHLFPMHRPRAGQQS